MTFPFFPLHDLRISMEEYLCDPEETSGLLYDSVQESITLMNDTIADFMLSSKEDAVLKRYMRTWQEQIRQIFDQVPLSWLEDLDPEDPSAYDDPSSRHKNVCYECFRLLKEMQIQYPSYFDRSCAPPLIYIEVEKSMYHHKVLIIEQWIEENGKHMLPLWQIINEHIKRLWHQGANRYSYEEHDYTFNLITQLLNQINAQGECLNNSKLYSLLFYVNFNDISFMHHITTSITEELENTVLDYEKVKILKNMDSTCSDILIRNDLALDPGNPPINQMLKRWLKGQLEELDT